MSHVILLGDSVFDNGNYVLGETAVVSHVRSMLPTGWEVTLLAVDGHRLDDVASQLIMMPSNATHLVISVGFNDALNNIHLLYLPAQNASEVFDSIGSIYAKFRDDYTQLLRNLCDYKLPLVVCTMYDACPLPDEQQRRLLVPALAFFNDAIIRAANQFGLPVIDLRRVCTEDSDFSPRSPLEPSAKGGAAIARSLCEAVLNHPFALRRTVLYPSEEPKKNSGPLVRRG